jgi:hypothetical protein
MKKTFLMLPTLFLFSLSVLAADPVGEVKLLDRYEKLMEDYPPTGEQMKACKLPQLRTDKKAKRYKTVLSASFKQVPPTPNFCGKYYVFDEPITGGGAGFISDCVTGRIERLQEKFHNPQPFIKVSSCLLIESPPREGETKEAFKQTAYGPPRLYYWKKSKLIRVADPVWPKH